MTLTRADCLARDRADDALAHAATRFAAGAPGTIYLDANSIGPMPADAPARVQRVLDDGWRVARRRAWNELDWLDQPRALGAAIAPLLGADADDVRVCDSTSVNLYKLLRLALAAAAPRRVVAFQRDVFPSDAYVAQGIARAGRCELRACASDADIEAALAPGDVAVLLLSHVDYRSSARLDLATLTALAHRRGALVLWDLSHSAGAVPARLRDAQADLAVGCGYKYLCGGPGAPAWLYVHPRLHDSAWPAIAGWMGHADPFAFAPDYRPAAGVTRLQVATPAVLANAAFGAAAAIWKTVSPPALERRHAALGETLIRLVDEQCAGVGIALASPRDAAHRGGHVALRFAAPGADVHALGQALVAARVVVSTRKPDALRLAPHPLVTRHVELWDAVQRLREILTGGSWREPRFAAAAV